MEQDRAIEAFGALAQTSRMAIFRLLVQTGPDGLPVGEIGRRLDIRPSTLSGHLTVLKRAGLLHATRRQREIHYAANLSIINDLVRFLLSDCCHGQVEHCSQILSLLSDCHSGARAILAGLEAPTSRVILRLALRLLIDDRVKVEEQKHQQLFPRNLQRYVGAGFAHAELPRRDGRRKHRVAGRILDQFLDPVEGNR